MKKHYRYRVATFVATLAAIRLFSGTENADTERFTFNVPIVSQRVTIDGRLDESAWKDAAEIQGLTGIKEKKTLNDAVFLVMADKRWLYIGFEARNPHMRFLGQKWANHDDPVQEDEAVEILLDPGTDGKTFLQYFLNLGNAQAEQFNRDGGASVSRGWRIPWRSATQRRDDGWTAEIAIPRFTLTANGDPAKASMNLAYYRHLALLDPYGAKMEEKREDTYIWRPFKSSIKEPERFARLNGLGDPKPVTPFLPDLQNAKVTGYVIGNDIRGYGVAVNFKNATTVPGVVAVTVTDSPRDGLKTRVEKEVALKGREEKFFSVLVPIDQFGEREVQVVLTDAKTGDLIGRVSAEETDQLRVMETPYAERNYYTNEDEVRVRCRVNLPASELKKYELVIKDKTGATLKTVPAAGLTEFALPFSALAMGENPLKFELTETTGEVRATAETTVRRLAPNPGKEVKVDQFTRVLLKDGKPILPVGVYMRYTGSKQKEVFKLLADAGFNEVVKLGSYVNRGYKNEPETALADSRDYLATAEEHGLMTASWGVLYIVEQLPGNAAERISAAAKIFQRDIRPYILREIAITKQFKEFLFYKNVDEPNLEDPPIKTALSGMFSETVRAADPYRPIYSLFAREIPRGFQSKWADIWCYDVYILPYWDRDYSDVANEMAYRAAELREKTEKEHKVMFMAPSVGKLDLGRTPLPLTPEQQLCQTYVCLIFGAKGFNYFSWGNVYPMASWEKGLGEAARQIRELSPALLTGDIPRSVDYGKENPDVLRGRFPLVYAALFKRPEGGHVLLATNGRDYPVDATFSGGAVAASDEAVSMFGNKQTLEINDGAFTERLEPYATRAYVLDEETTDPTVKLTSTGHPDQRVVDIHLFKECDTIAARKNVMANPLFKSRRIYPNVPDFCHYSACLPNAGDPESDFYLDPVNPYKGDVSLRLRHTPYENCSYLNGKGYRGFDAAVGYVLPKMDKSEPYVFSFWARGGKEGDKVRVYIGALGVSKTFAFTKDWKRYSLSAPVKELRPAFLPVRGVSFAPEENATVWIDALQMEKGETPSDFTEE